jgi:hypothetical protein
MQGEPHHASLISLSQGHNFKNTILITEVHPVLKSWKASCRGMGIPINDTYLFSLNYADDQTVLAQDAFDLEYMMRKLCEFQQNRVYGGE